MKNRGTMVYGCKIALTNSCSILYPSLPIIASLTVQTSFILFCFTSGYLSSYVGSSNVGNSSDWTIKGG